MANADVRVADKIDGVSLGSMGIVVGVVLAVVGLSLWIA